MTYARSWRGRYSHEWVFGAISAGLFFIIVGFIFFTTPHLPTRLIEFITGFTIIQVPNTLIFLPAPANPAVHVVVYNAFLEFSLGWAIVQIIILAVRLAFRSQLGRTAETLGNTVFWWGTFYLAKTWLVETRVTTAVWFEFWALIIVMIGISLIIRAAFLAAARTLMQKQQPIYAQT